MERETAMKILKELHNKSLFAERTALETIIPELKESEDERVKKRILLSLEKDLMATKNSGCDTQDLEQCIAWLEKQCEQKTAVTDFNAKDWYVSKVDGKIHDMTYNPADKVEPIFNIGDVLCDKSCTTLNKKYQPIIEILDIRNGMYICNNCSFPISQQYEYELVTKKNEPQSAWSDEDEIEIPFGAKDSELQEATYYIPKGFHAEIDDDKVAIKKGEKPAAWNVEDSSKVQRICKYLDEAKKYYADITEVRECMDWLKSLKQRIGWKPSEEQIHAFIQVYVWYSNNFAPSETLTSLYNDLKKL